jgi:hypothetical protein
MIFFCGLSYPDLPELKKLRWSFLKPPGTRDLMMGYGLNSTD